MSVIEAAGVGEVAKVASDSFGKIASESQVALMLRNALLELIAQALGQDYPLSPREKDQMQRANDLVAALLPFTQAQVAGLCPDPRRDPLIIEELRRAHVAFQLEAKVSI